MKIVKLIATILTYLIGIFLFLATFVFSLFIFSNVIFSQSGMNSIVRRMNIVEKGIFDDNDINHYDNLYDSMDLKISEVRFKNIINNSKLKHQADKKLATVISKTLDLKVKDEEYIDDKELEEEIIKKIEKHEKLNDRQKELINKLVRDVEESSDNFKNNTLNNEYLDYVKDYIKIVKDYRVIILYIVILVISLLLIGLLNMGLSKVFLTTAYTYLGVGLIYGLFFILMLFIPSLLTNYVTNTQAFLAISDYIAKVGFINALIYIVIGIIPYLYSKKV